MPLFNPSSRIIGKSANTQQVGGSSPIYDINNQSQPQATAVNNATKSPQKTTETTSSSSHKSKDTTDSAKPDNYQFVDSNIANTILQGILAGSGTENILNRYQQVAYHFRFFCVNFNDLYSTVGSPPTSTAFFNAIIPEPNSPISQSNSKVKTVIVAESGSTIYNITDVEFTSMIGPNLDTRNVNIGTFTMTIVEPLGGSFLTALKAASDACGNENFKNCFYYLELSFKAYNTDGTVVSNIFPSSIPINGASIPLTMQQGDRWIWEVQITNIDINIDTGGGTYTLQMVNSGDIALDDDIHTIPDTISVAGATVGDYFENLGKALSDSWFVRNGNYDVKYGDISKNIPAFKFFPIQFGPNSPPYVGVKNGQSPATFNIIDNTVDPDTLPQQTKPTTDVDNGVVQGILQSGLTIEQLIDSVLASTKQGQILGLGGNNPLTNPPDIGSTTPNQCFVFRVIPTVIYNKFYNSWSGRYQMTITYNVIPYFTQYPILTPIQVYNNTSATAIQNVVQRGLLQKHYDYIYTSNNTEIINLNISFNNMWNVQLPRFYGLIPDSLSVQVNKKIGQKPNISKTNLTTYATKTLNKKATLAQELTAISNAMGALNNVQEDSNTMTDAGITTQLSDSSSTLNNDVTSANTAIGNLHSYGISNISISTSSSDSFKKSLENAQKSLANTSNTLQTQFLSNQQPEVNTPNYQFAEDLITNQTGSTGTFSFPISFVQGYKDVYDQSGITIGNDTNSDKTLLGSVLNQMYNYSGNPLMSIELTIRGDPFWLGETNLSKSVYLRGNGNPPPASSYQSPHMFGEQNIVLSFKIPFQESSSTFQPVLLNDMMYTGVYIVTQITNKFVNGQFTQVLSGLRQPLISVLNAQGYTTNITSDGSSGT